MVRLERGVKLRKRNTGLMSMVEFGADIVTLIRQSRLRPVWPHLMRLGLEGYYTSI